MSYVHPKLSCVVATPGGRVRLSPSQVWDDDDPFVKDHPEYFAPDPVTVTRSPGYQPVEQATAAPGERRSVRRAPRKPAADDKTKD